METNTILNVVGIKCPADQEADVFKWLTESDVPGLMRFKKLKGCTVLKLLRPDEKQPTYLLLWEFGGRKDFEEYEKSPERTEAKQKATKVWSDFQVEQLWRAQFEVVKTFER
ncbi:MAG: hypothetical protein HYX79_05665 [Chloroflexi bacterium]|nr:hypothetical protein [Chloroflexota bacterium]